MPDLYMNVDENVNVPVNILQLIDDTDFKSIEASVVFNQAGLALFWNFTTVTGVYTKTQVTPTDTGGDYDWVNKLNGMYQIEIPASGGASINNDTEGFGKFTGVADGILPWRSPVIGFRPALLNNSLIVGLDKLQIDIVEIGGVVQSAADLKDFADNGYNPVTKKVQGIDIILGLNQENYFLDNTTYSSGQLTAGRIRIYSDAGSVGSGSNVIATYNVVGVYSSGLLSSYKVTKQ